MPVKSEAQRRYLNMRFGHDWVKKHHFDQKGKLPAKSRGQRGQEDMVRRFMKRGKRRKGSRGQEARQ